MKIISTQNKKEPMRKAISDAIKKNECGL